MRFNLPCSWFLAAVLLAGCTAGEPALPSDQSPPPEPSATAAEPAADKPAQPVFVDDPNSPYPMAVEHWQADMDGDGAEELVELRAEKAYSPDESEQWVEITYHVMHPYTLVVTRGDVVYELPLGREDDDGSIRNPWYFSSEDSEYTGTCWTTDLDGNPVLALWFDTISAGGAGRIEVYAAAFSGDEPVLLPVPEYGIRATLDEETMLSQVTVLETGYTETLDLMVWLANYEKQMTERHPDSTPGPIYNEDGALSWPVAPGQIDSYHHAEPAKEGITLRQYLYGTVHMDGMGNLVTTLSWIDGQPVVLNQRFEWYY